MPDYKNSKIYTIRCRNDPTLIYVGSTTQQLSQRWAKHRSRIGNEKYKYKLYNKINEIGLDLFYIELYEDYPCKNKENLLKREGEVIRQIGTLNMLIAGRTDQEYRNDNKEELNNKKKQYYENNKAIILDRQKIYTENNRDKINERKKKYYENNKEHDLKQKTEKIECCCGKFISRCNIAKHLKVKSHLDLMEAKNSQQDTDQS